MAPPVVSSRVATDPHPPQHLRRRVRIRLCPGRAGGVVEVDHSRDLNPLLSAFICSTRSGSLIARFVRLPARGPLVP